jgi:hypothetical protein
MRKLETGATIGIAVTIAVAAAAFASETVSYTYDARGRLIKVEHSGTINNDVTANYTLDKAGNRVNLKVTGAP